MRPVSRRAHPAEYRCGRRGRPAAAAVGPPRPCGRGGKPAAVRFEQPPGEHALRTLPLLYWLLSGPQCSRCPRRPFLPQDRGERRGKGARERHSGGSRAQPFRHPLPPPPPHPRRSCNRNAAASRGGGQRGGVSGNVAAAEDRGRTQPPTTPPSAAPSSPHPLPEACRAAHQHAGGVCLRADPAARRVAVAAQSPPAAPPRIAVAVTRVRQETRKTSGGLALRTRRGTR